MLQLPLKLSGRKSMQFTSGENAEWSERCQIGRHTVCSQSQLTEIAHNLLTKSNHGCHENGTKKMRNYSRKEFVLSQPIDAILSVGDITS